MIEIRLRGGRFHLFLIIFLTIFFVVKNIMETKTKSTSEPADSGGYSFSINKPLIEDKTPSGRGGCSIVSVIS